MSYATNGTDGKVTSNGTDLDVTGYTLDLDAPVIDTTTTGDAGWEDNINGPIKASGTFDFLWNPSKNPFGSVIGMMPGAYFLGKIGDYPTLSFRLDSGNFATGKAIITKLSLKSEVKGTKKFTASFQNKGAWTVPTV